MRACKKYGWLLFLVILLVDCKSKKASLAGDEPVEVGDFIDFFPDTKLPYLVADSNLLKKESKNSVQLFIHFKNMNLIIKRIPFNRSSS